MFTEPPTRFASDSVSWARPYGLAIADVVITSILALNDHGQLVGWGKLDLTEWEAIIWDAENGLRMLDDLLDASSQQYTGLRFGVGINNAGQIAASDSVFGFLLTPFVLGDMNCDDAVNAGDVNQDARFDGADIDAFFKLLGGG